jgi:hypothetical protein
MGRLLIGSVVAAVAMFLLGFVFYATPLMNLAQADAPAETQLAVQEALKALPRSGTYFIPLSETDQALMAAHQAGPTALIKVNMTGAPQMDPAVFAFGWLHMAVSALLLGLLLWAVRDRVSDFAGRMRLVVWVALVMAVFTRLGEPIWYRSDWANALYVGVADLLTIVVAGFVIARWFMPKAAS